MLEIDYTEKEGWKNPLISEYHNFSINPFNSSLHYAIQLFEGMKAFKSEDNKIILFRPQMNMERMNISAKRLCLPVNNFFTNYFIH
jgi:branched-chain amino acid aminotransferase